MNSKILTFINLLEGYKTAIKSLHWNSNSVSQHEKCDEVAEEIANFQDVVSEVEQSISGNLPFNKLKGTEYHITNIQKFMKDLIANTKKFHKELGNMGDDYIGVRSECETFLTNIQRLSYLIDFTLKESFKQNYKKKINEGFETEDGILNDAIEAINMSDGQIDFYEWADAYMGEDENYLRDVWNQACDETGYSVLKENKMNRNKVTLSESQLSSVINEAINNVMTRFINESIDESNQAEAEIKGGMYNDKELDYTHFAVNKMTNLIVDGWCYAGYDSEDLKADKNYYFNNDLKENGFNPKVYKILSFKGCQKQGIDPNNKQLWSNTGVYALPQEIQMQKQGQNPYAAAQQEHPDWFVKN